MKLFFPFIILVITSLSFCSCNKEKKDFKKSLISNAKDSVKGKDIFMDIIMEKDTLNAEEQNGVIKVWFRLNDTIKFTLKDQRHIIAFLALVPKSNITKNSIEPIERIKKELNLKLRNSNDTIKIPFKITPRVPGKSSFVCLISDIYILHAYNKSSNKVRMITYEHGLKKDVYVK